MKWLVFIPARGGSKGIPAKNIVDAAGKPLMAWTIEAAQQSQYRPDIFISTDDEAIAQVAANYGCSTDYRRPAALASDTATTVDAVLDGVAWLAQQHQHYDALILLQPTSPLRTHAHLDEAIRQWQSRPDQPLVSVCEPAHPPYLLFSEQDNQQWQRLAPVPKTGRRQDASTRYAQINGAIFIQSIERLLQQRTFFEEGHSQFYFMPAAASIDIDTPVDLLLAQLLLKQQS